MGMLMRRTGAAAAALVVGVLGVTSPAYAGPADHDHSTPAAPSHDHSGHGTVAMSGPDDGTGPDASRLAVLGGFGAVNVAVVGTAFVLRRRDRRSGRFHGPRNVPA